MQLNQALKLFRKELPEGFDAGIKKVKGGYEIDFVKKTDAAGNGFLGARCQVKLLSRGKCYELMADAIAHLEREDAKLKLKEVA